MTSSTQSPIIAYDLVRTFGSGEDEVRAVDGVNLEVTAGEVFGFLGPNGAGKSTTVRILTTLLKPSAGSASVAGYDIEGDADAIRRSIGVALQDAAIDPLMTGTELLRLQAVLYGIPRNAQHERAGELLERVGLSAAGDRRVGTYSGGMRRRLDLALALIHKPSVLFLDEPTTGLHFEDIRKLLGVVNGLVDKGNTVIVIEHNLDVIKVSDWVIDMGPEGGSGGGMVVAQGDPEAVAAVSESYTGKFLQEALTRESVVAPPVKVAPKKRRPRKVAAVR